MKTATRRQQHPEAAPRRPSPPSAALPSAQPETDPLMEEVGGYYPEYIEHVPTAGLCYRFEEGPEPGSVRLRDLHRLARTCPAALLQALAAQVFDGSPLEDAIANMSAAVAWGHPDVARILADHTYAAVQECWSSAKRAPATRKSKAARR